MTRLFGDVLGYEAEVCVPNGTPVRAWVTDRYGQEAQARFDRWLADHDKRVRVEALQDAAKDARGMHDPFPPDRTEWADLLDDRANREARS